MTRWECYIEEYEFEGGLAARLRDKKSGKRITIQITSLEEKMHFLQFLNAAKANKEIMPTVFNPNGNDVVAVYGIKQEESDEEILVDINIHHGGYLFE